jgi:hypothetical protein
MRAVIYSVNNSHRDGRMTCLTPNSDSDNLSVEESRPSSEGSAPVLSGAEIRGGSPVPLNRYQLDGIIALISIIVETVWAWIAGIQMRVKIKRDLGRKATEADLSSIETWIKVDEVEQQNERNGPLKPD